MGDVVMSGRYAKYSAFHSFLCSNEDSESSV